jgi:hypothetical protein
MPLLSTFNCVPKGGLGGVVLKIMVVGQLLLLAKDKPGQQWCGLRRLRRGGTSG